MPDPRRDVTGKPPPEQHATALHTLDDRMGRAGSGGWQGGRDLEGLNGRRRILQRHAPEEYREGHFICGWCQDVGFPCIEYRDAADGLVTGLENTRP